MFISVRIIIVSTEAKQGIFCFVKFVSIKKNLHLYEKMNYYVFKSEGRNIYSNLLDEFHNLSTYIFGLDLLILIKLRGNESPVYFLRN